MSKKTKKTKKKHHVSYNKKAFLAPESILSMAAIHTKIKNDGIAILRISDCNQSIRIWNDLNNREEIAEMLYKISTIQDVLGDFAEELKLKLP